MGGIKHKGVGDSLSKSEWLDTESHEIIGNVDMDYHFLLHHKMRHFVHATVNGAGAVDVTIESIPAGALEQDFHVYKLVVSVDEPPGSGKTFSMSFSNGVSEMTVTLVDEETSGSTTENAFDVDVSAQACSLKYSQDVGADVCKATVLIMYYYKENA